MTIVEVGPQLMAREDSDASQEIRRFSPTKALRFMLPPSFSR